LQVVMAGKAEDEQICVGVIAAPQHGQAVVDLQLSV
jgi:hypothetical protein